jgi:hypothetical protein
MNLFFFAHQDDEFFAAQFIQQQIAAGNKLKVIYTTNGKYANHSVETRKQEALSALSKIGVSKSDVIFLGHSLDVNDGEVYLRLDLIFKNILDQCDLPISDVRSIYVTAYEGGHHDHDATYLLASALASKCSKNVKIIEFFLYNSIRVHSPFFRVMDPATCNNIHRISLGWNEIFLNLSMILSYRSQWKTFIGLLPQIIYALVIKRKIVFRSPPHPFDLNDKYAGMPLYARRGRLDIANFSDATSQFIREFKC